MMDTDGSKFNEEALKACDIHTITGALKQYLRDLNEPLFPFSLYDKALLSVGMWLL